MERFKRLNGYQKGILIVMIVMAAIFWVVYFVTISRVGFQYLDTIFVPSQENGSTIYSGKLQDQPAQFTVSEDKTVLFTCGAKTYGPYTATEDPTAVLADHRMSEFLTGIELREGDSIVFRGGISDSDGRLLLYTEDGTPDISGITITIDDGVAWDESGSIIDPLEPSVSTILTLMSNPPLTHKGDWFAWFAAVGICILNGVLIFFADELFRWNLQFEIRNPEQAEPSDWEIAGRYIGWTGLPIIALIVFITGLA